jgi:hypothetical protein
MYINAVYNRIKKSSVQLFYGTAKYLREGTRSDGFRCYNFLFVCLFVCVQGAEASAPCIFFMNKSIDNKERHK